MIILLDYDGTLTPIVSKPWEAKIDPDRKRFIEELSKEHTVAIVTGRDMKSFKEVFGEIPSSLYIITSHGARIYRDNELVADFLEVKMPDLSELRDRIKNMEGVCLEEKEGCFALHYRGFKGNEEEIKKVFREFIEKYPPVKVIEGKKVLEGVYGSFDKGKAVENFLEFIGWDGKEPVVYIGDDTTDFYAFRKVKELGGTAVYVGEEKPPEADMNLRDVEEVYEFLRSLSTTKR